MLEPRKTGTLADAVEAIPELAPVKPTSIDLAPEKSLGEWATEGWSLDTFRASRAVQRVDNSDFERRMLHDGYQPILDALGPTVYDERQYLDRSYKTYILNPGSLPYDGQTTQYGSAPSIGQMEEAIAAEIRRRRVKQPDFLKGVPDTVKDLRARFAADEKNKRTTAQATVERSEGLGGLLSSLAGSATEAFNDPINIITLPIGGGGKTFVQVFAREALINGVLELGQQPQAARNREMIGEELTLGEAAGNVVLTAAAGGTLEALIHGAGKALSPLARRAIDKIKAARQARDPLAPAASASEEFGDLDNRELAAVAREIIGDDKLSPDERAAIATLEREQEVGETSPFVSGPAGEAKHNEGLSQAINELLENRPTRGDPVAPTSGAGAPTLAPERPPAGASTPAARPQATGAPHARLDEFAGELEKRGIPAPIARGAAAGLLAESAGALHARGPVTAATRGDRALGYGQWLFERQAELIKRYGPNPTHAQQLDYLAWELKGGDKGGASVMAAGDEVDALGRYIRDFMRPAKGRETDGDIARGMAALGRAGDRPAPASAGVAAGAAPALAPDPRIAQLRAEALELGDSIVGLTRLADGTPVNLFTRSVSAAAIGVDATRFQFKSGGDEFGVTDRLKGIKEWDAGLAGRVTLWEDEAGKLWIADGHQRHGLARRIAAESGADVRMDAMVLRSADGVTAAEARVWAALKNIAEGTGTMIDAAKVLRDAGAGALDRLPPKSPLVRDGAALSRLSDDAFGAVWNERILPDQAAVIGHLLPDNPETHIGMVDLLIKVGPANRAQATSIVRQAIAAGFHSEEQLDLLGSSSSVSPLFLEKAKILERGLARLRKMGLVHRTAAANAGELEAKGSTIARAQSEKEAQANAEAAEIIDRLAYRAGPVADALNDAARELAGGARLGDASDRFAARIRELDLGALARGDAIDRGAVDGAGREGDAGQADAALSEEPGLDGPGFFDEQPTLVELEAATARFSDPDGAAVKQQADSLAHDLKGEIDTREAFELERNSSFLVGLAGVLDGGAEGRVGKFQWRRHSDAGGDWISVTEDGVEGDGGDDISHLLTRGLELIKSGKVRDELKPELERIVGAVEARFDADGNPAKPVLHGAPIDDEWVRFAPQSGTLGIPRADMPQVKGTDRPALLEFLAGRGIAAEDAIVPAASLKPTQAEFSLEKVASWDAGGAKMEDRRLIVSSDGHIVDGHHQWVKAVESGDDIGIIRLDRPIREVLEAVHAFPLTRTGAGGVGLETVLSGQRGAELEDLFARAAVNQEQLGTLGPELAELAGVEFVNPGAKGRARVLEKIADYADPGEIKDLARGGFLVTERGQGQAIVDALRGRGFDVYDKGWKPLNGYLDRKLVVRFPNGGVAEIQFIPKAIADYKFGEGHALYERARDPSTPIEEFERIVLQMKARYEELLEGTDFAALGKDAESAASSSSVPSSMAERTVDGEAGRQAPASNTNPELASSTATGLSSSSKNLIDGAPSAGDNGLSVASPQVAPEPGRLQLRRVGTPGTFSGRGYELAGDQLEAAAVALKSNRASAGIEFGDGVVRFPQSSLSVHFDALRKAKVPIDLVDLDGAVIRDAKLADVERVSSDQTGRLAAPALDRGAAEDPGKASRDRQLIQLGAAAPLRAGGDVDQRGEIGLGLFDAADQGKLTFRLDDDGGAEISAEELLAELDADAKTIATLRGCL